MPHGNPDAYGRPQLNSMDRFRQQQQAAGVAPMAPEPQYPPPPQRTSILRGLLEAMGLAGQPSPGIAGAANGAATMTPAPPPAPPVPPQSVDSLIRGMRDTTARAARIR